MKTFSKVSDFKNKIGTIPVGQGLVVLKCSVVLIVQHRTRLNCCDTICDMSEVKALLFHKLPDIKYAR